MQNELFPPQKPRKSNGQFATEREAILSKRERKISLLEYRDRMNERKIIALIELNKVLTEKLKQNERP